jgi:polyvinyl alcohol dehydrogenase (cytochrome)
VLALDAATGNTLWKTYTIDETPVVQSQNRSGTNMMGPSGAMVWNCPTIDARPRTGS